MASVDTDLQQLVINVGTQAQIEAAIQGGTITQDMLSVTTDGPDYQEKLTAGSNINISGNTISATDTTYTGSDGITLTGTNFKNSGVRSVSSGTANGTISVNTNGTSADVSVTGLGSAAYTASSDYATSAQGTLADNAANKNLSNLTSTGANIGNWSSNVTNCITEIPQDINLELSGGTLILKAGSKVYVPNGSGVFNDVTISADKSTTSASNDTRLYFYNGSYIEKFPVSQCYSGTTAPSGQTYMFWYDTTNNVVKKTNDGGTTWESGWSLPFAKITATSGAISSIDQVFNGFGYIGSTIFALPNIKGLAPDGRNTDGTLKSVAFTTSSVKTQTLTTNTFNNRNIILKANSFGFSASASYDEKTNTVSSGTEMIVGNASASSGKITSLYTKQAFHAVDYDDFISADAQNVKITGNQHIKDIKTFDSGQINIGNAGYYNNKIEFATSTSATNGGYIDFHYAGSAADYTSRIMETASGQLTLTASNGSLLSVSPADTDNSKKIATTEFVNNVKNRNITNCITEIPQDINLELSGGTLTLKAGSKVHMADGNLDTTTTTTADITRTSPYNGQYMLILYGNSIFNGFVDSCLSGTIANRPNSTAHNAGMYFATDENKIYVTNNAGATWVHAANMSMPFAIITVSSGAITSIDQVFNGFGYIGSTVFVLPGVKALIPNGRNSDGTLKNRTVVTNNVKVLTNASNLTVDLWYVFKANGTIENSLTNYWTYDVQKNLWMNGNVVFDACVFAKSSVTSGVISNFSAKNVFRAVDYGDSEYIAHCAMPSGRYIDLSTSISSGYSYTSPADGYLAISMSATGAGQFLRLQNSTNGLNMSSMSYASGNNMRNSIQVSKGDSITITFNSTGSISIFRFIYANGAK